METFTDFAAVGGAIVASLGIALSLEWFALNGLFRLMPSRRASSAQDESVPRAQWVVSMGGERSSRAFRGVELGRVATAQLGVTAPTGKRAA